MLPIYCGGFCRDGCEEESLTGVQAPHYVFPYGDCNYCASRLTRHRWKEGWGWEGGCLEYRQESNHNNPYRTRAHANNASSLTSDPLLFIVPTPVIRVCTQLSGHSPPPPPLHAAPGVVIIMCALYHHMTHFSWVSYEEAFFEHSANNAREAQLTERY